MLTRIHVDDWDELIPYEQVTLVMRASPGTQVQARFHHAISGRGGGWQGMFEVGGVVSTRYTSADWNVLRVCIVSRPPAPPLVDEQEGHWHNGSSSEHGPIFVPLQAAVADTPTHPAVDRTEDHPGARWVGRARFIRAILTREGRTR